MKGVIFMEEHCETVPTRSRKPVVASRGQIVSVIDFYRHWYDYQHSSFVGITAGHMKGLNFEIM